MFLTAEDLKIKKEIKEPSFGKIILEPLPAGYANTLGSSIRRILLSSIRGSAPTQLEIEGATHQFTTIKGIKEDIVEITLNVKQMVVKLYDDKPVILTINVKGGEKGAKVIKAGNFECPSGAEVINKDLVIATLTDAKSKFSANILVEPGYGYVPAEAQPTSKVGVIVLDSIFSPVVSVGYSVEPARVGHQTGLDRLIFEIKTNGTAEVYDVFMEASKILKDFFSRIATGKESLKEELAEKPVEAKSGPVYKPEEVMVEELHLPTRTINALKKADVKTLGDLSKLSREDMLTVRNLGEKSIDEILKLLETEGLQKV